MNARLAAVAILYSLPATAESGGALRVWLGSGYDSNARRDFVSADPNGQGPTPEGSPRQDVVFSALANAEGKVEGASSHLAGSYDFGARKFLKVSEADVLIQSAAAEGMVALGRSFGLGLAGRAKDHRGGDRDYSDLSGEGFLELVPSPRLELRLRGGAHRFVYWNRIAYSFSSPELGAYARYRFDRRHSAFAFGDLGFRKYMDLAEPDQTAVRRDLALSAGAGYAFRGQPSITVSYAFAGQRSNSAGESALRHRVAATFGSRLFWGVTLIAQATVQLSRLGGFCLSSEASLDSLKICLLEDEEAHNSLSAKLVRPVSDHMDVELRYALYVSLLPENKLSYSRHLGWLGLSWRL
ncbi:MAG: hypothetical protein HYZ28_06910 [Myxococcales bacterium]|nr:hypothetical protein [Myxococcales bacterium]